MVITTTVHTTDEIWDSWSGTTFDGHSDNVTWGLWTDSGTTSFCSNAQNSNTSTSSSNGVWHTWNHEYTYVPMKSEIECVSVSFRRGELEQHCTPTAPEVSKRQKQRDDAEIKAKDLLMDLIGKDQLTIYEETGRLFVKGNKFDYIVSKRGFIKKIEKKKIIDLCVHLANKYKFPTTDNVIAMKMAIEADEDRILELANNHGSCKRPDKLPKAACM